VSVRWVFVHDKSGTHRDQYFFTTDVAMSVRSLIETYTGRWNIETTFEEIRSYLRVQTTRGWRQDTVLRMGPCLFGLYTIVAWLYAELPGRRTRFRVVDWMGKRNVSFSDAIGLGREAIFVTLLVASPVLILSMLVGLIVSIFQAVTQIQEPTLAFIPKILVSGLAILFFGPFMLAILTDFTSRIFANIAHIPIK